MLWWDGDGSLWCVCLGRCCCAAGGGFGCLFGLVTGEGGVLEEVSNNSHAHLHLVVLVIYQIYLRIYILVRC